MSGHGHVIPNKNGMLARCGGPAICSVCKAEMKQLTVGQVIQMVETNAKTFYHPEEVRLLVNALRLSENRK